MNSLPALPARQPDPRPERGSTVTNVLIVEQSGFTMVDLTAAEMLTPVQAAVSCQDHSCPYTKKDQSPHQ